MARPSNTHTFNNVTKTTEDWAKHLGIHIDTFRHRLRKYGDLDEYRYKVFANKQGLYTYNNTTQDLQSWATEYDMPIDLLRNRLGRVGWDFKKSLTTPVQDRSNNTVKLHPSIIKRIPSDVLITEIKRRKAAGLL